MTTVAPATDAKPATPTASADLVQQVKDAIKAAADAAAASRAVANDLALFVEATRRTANTRPRRFGLNLRRK